MTLVERSTKSPWIMLLLCAFVVIFLNASITAPSPILTLIMEDLNLSYTEGGLITTAYFIGYALGQIPWGYLADRFKTGKIIALSALGTSIFMLLFGWTSSTQDVIMWRFLTGLLGAGIFVPGVRIVSTWFPSEKRGTAIGLFGASGSFGPIFAAPVSSLIASAYGWRWSIWLLAALGLPISFPLWFLLKEKDESSLSREESLNDWTEMIKQKDFWILGFDQFVRLGAYLVLLSWFPTFLLETYGIDRFLSSLSLVVISAVSIFSNAIGGLISDRVGEKAVIMSALTVLIPAFCLLVAMKNWIVVWILVIFLALFLTLMRAPSFSILPKLYDVRSVGKASGYQNTFAAIGALTLPIILGYTKDYTTSFDAGWIFLSILFGLASIMTTFLSITKVPLENGKLR